MEYKYKWKQIIAFSLFVLITTHSVLTYAMEQFILIEQKDLPRQLGTFRHIQSVNDINIEFYTVLLNDSYHARIYQQKQNLQSDAVSLRELQKVEKFLVGINGSFYTEEFKPVGLFIDEGRLLKPISRGFLLNSCVLINDKKIVLETNRKNCLNQFSAMQIGPTLIQQNHIATNLETLKNKSKKTQAFFAEHRRTILALTNHNKLLIITSTPISLMKLTTILKDSPDIFGVNKIKTAVNLDGGSSTGMYIQFDNNPFYYPEYKNVKTLLLFD